MTAREPSTLIVHDLRVTRSRHEILHGIALEVPPGTVFGVVGPNGAGKSTLLSALALGGRGVTGDMRWGPTNLAALTPKERAHYTSYVPQDTALSFALTVADVVRLGTMVTAIDTAQAERRVTDALADVGCTDLGGQTVARLSGGQSQLVHIARALAQQAPVLVMDEPVSALDLGHQMQVMATAARYTKRGATVIVSLHDLDIAARFCDLIAFMQDGRVVAVGTPREVLTADRLSAAYRVQVTATWDDAVEAVRVTGFPGEPAVQPVRNGEGGLKNTAPEPNTSATRENP